MQDSAGLITRREALGRAAVLLGVAISAPTVAGVLAGCGRRRDIGGSAEAWRGRALSAWQDELVTVIAEHIIPETDTPGAAAVGVNRFIDEMLAGFYTAEQRESFLAGLVDVDDRSRQLHGRRFLQCTPEQQRALLAELDREAFAPARRPAADRAESATAAAPAWIHGEGPRPRQAELPFFRTMKELTVVGYYTSEIGATVELRHEPIPGRHEGCVPFEEIGRTWAV